MSKRTHEQLENRERLDALDLRYNSFLVGCKFIPILYRDRNIVKIPGEELQIETMHSPVCDVVYLICPRCGSRRRFIFYPEMLCQDCAKLHYAVQMRSHGDRRNVAEFLDKHLAGSEARPPGMRKKRYDRLIRRYGKHRKAAEEREEKAFDRFFSSAFTAAMEDKDFVEAWEKMQNEGNNFFY